MTNDADTIKMTNFCVRKVPEWDNILDDYMRITEDYMNTVEFIKELYYLTESISSIVVGNSMYLRRDNVPIELFNICNDISGILQMMSEFTMNKGRIEYIRNCITENRAKRIPYVDTYIGNYII